MRTYRQTPPGEPTVADLLHPGDIVRTSYGTGPYVVVRIAGPYSGAGFPPGTFAHFVWMVCLNDFEADSDARTLFADKAIGGLVAIGGRLVKAWTPSDDEVFVIGHDEWAAHIAHRIPVQLDMFGGGGDRW